MGNRSIYSLGNESALPSKMRKTERSHEENQERAYVAASRRADRSIEARVQSARMASEIHKKRTGKGFRISEEIVLREEMYEEEEEFFPRSHRLLGPHMQTASPEMNLRMEAYLTNKMAMSAMVAGNNDSWRQNDIHTQFAQFFPNANRQAQQMNHRMSQQMRPEDLPAGDQSASPIAKDQRVDSLASTVPSIQEDIVSPVESNPKTPATDADYARSMDADSPADLSGQSAFTTELPAEARMLMAGSCMDMADPFSQNFYGQDWSNSGNYYDFSEDSGLFKPESAMDTQPDFYSHDGMVPTRLDQQQEINWDSFVNEDWSHEQHQ